MEGFRLRKCQRIFKRLSVSNRSYEAHHEAFHHASKLALHEQKSAARNQPNTTH